MACHATASANHLLAQFEEAADGLQRDTGSICHATATFLGHGAGGSRQRLGKEDMLIERVTPAAEASSPTSGGAGQGSSPARWARSGPPQFAEGDRAGDEIFAGAEEERRLEADWWRNWLAVRVCAKVAEPEDVCGPAGAASPCPP